MKLHMMCQIIVILLFCVFNVGAQNAFHVSNKTSGDTLLSIDNDGNLGIRVPQSGARLDVGMNAGGFWQRGIRLLNPALENGNQLLLTIGRSDDVNNAGNLYFTYDAEASELNRLSLGLYAVNDVLNILANGRVGIRTVEPQTSFEVNGAMKISGTGDLPEQVHYGMVMAGYYDDTDIGKIYVGDNSGWKFHFARRLNSTDTELMTIVDYGNVGIGTTNPQAKLQVEGTVHSTIGGFRFPDGSLQTTAITEGGAGSIDELSDGKTGGLSIFLGSGAGANDDESTNRNTGIGYEALALTTTGFNNSGTGYNALYSNTTGNYNIAYGHSALYSNTTGNFNVGLGMSANRLNQAGSQNTIIGFEAGRGESLHDKSGNIFLGYQAGYNETGSNKLYIENSDSDTPLIGGDFSADEIYLNGKVGIGTTTPSQILEVADTIYCSAGAFKFPDGTVQESAAVGGGAGNTLDEAYDQGSPGGGRTIIADNGAVTIAGTDGLLSTGTHGSGTIPAEGGGARMMWYPGKSAFRAGNVSSTQWDDAYVGDYSMALGLANRASGTASMACGALNNATQAYTTALGYGSLASANYATAIGQSCQASGANSFALGNFAYASGSNSFSLGHRIIASGDYTMAIALSDQSMLNVSQENTLAIMGGKVGINTANPENALDVEGIIATSVGLKFPDESIQLTAADSLDKLEDCISDGSSIFIGAGAGTNDNGSNENIALGLNALNSNSGARQNVAVGNNALSMNTSGEGNVAIGHNALPTNAGNENVFVGYHAEDMETEDIGYYNVSVGAIGSLPDLEGFLNSGNVSVGQSALAFNDFGSGNTAIGCQSLVNNASGHFNVANGYHALWSNQGGAFTWTSNEDEFASNDGSFNIALGYRPLYSNSGGYQNIAAGFEALFRNQGFINANPQLDPKNASFNIALGYRSLYNNGMDFDVDVQKSSYNIGLGYQSLYNNQNGNYNIGLGYSAGATNVDGDNNIFIGNEADASSDNLENAIAIGYNAVVDASNKVRIGNSNVTVIEGQVDFTYTSDKNKKENFQNIDSKDVLQKLSTFNIQSWNYKHDPQAIRHYGPVAQDFYAAFGHDGIGQVGSDTTLCGSDVNGINMIAIQALEKRTRELKDDNTKLLNRVSELEAANANLNAKLDKMKEILQMIANRMAESGTPERNTQLTSNKLNHDE